MKLTNNSDHSDFLIKADAMNQYMQHNKPLSIEDIYIPCVFTCNIKENYKIIFYTQILKIKLGYDLDCNIDINVDNIMLEEDFEIFKNLIDKNYSDGLKLFTFNFKLFDKNNNTHFCCANIDLQNIDTSHTITCSFVFIEDSNDLSAEIDRVNSLINNKSTCFFEHILDENNEYKLTYVSDNIKFYNKDLNKLDTNDPLYKYIHMHDKILHQHSHNANTSKDYSIMIETTPVSLNADITYDIFVQSIVVYKNDMVYCIDSFIKSINKQNQLNKRRQHYFIEIGQPLQRSTLISQILEKANECDDYLEILRMILSSVANFFEIDNIKLLMPKVRYEEIFNGLTYNKVTNKYNLSVIHKEDVYHDFPHIRNQINNFNYAFHDILSTSPGCEEDFNSFCDCACFMNKVKISFKKFGLIVLCDSTKQKVWDNNTIAVINDISNLITSIYHKHSSKKELSTSLSTMETILNNIDSYICVSTIDTDEIVFTNEKFITNFQLKDNESNLSNIININSKEYQQLNMTLQTYQENTLARCESYCKRTGQWLEISQTYIKWVDSKLMKLSTFNNITQKMEYEKLIEIQAQNDHLTGLPNRRMLEADFEMLVKTAIENNQTGYILFLDLDNFKNINDSLGHNYGDALLQNIANYLFSIEATANYSYRFGGDEFVILLPYNTMEYLQSVTDAIFNRFRDPWEILDTEYFCTMSMGVAKYPDDGTELLEVLKKADMAMYKAKKNGKNQLMYYINEIGLDSMKSIKLQKHLRESMSNNLKGFSVHFQPIIDTATKEVISAEALMRWNVDELGNIPPAEFIPVCEDLGFIIELGYFVIEEACKMCKQIVNNKNDNFKMHINISICQLMDDTFLSNTIKIIEKYNIAFSHLIFEITETIAIEDYKKIKKILNEIDKAGIRISLDDFGTGHSSLNHLKEMPIENIKLDKSFIDNLTHDEYTQSFVSAIIILAHKLNLRVCAEGVEEKAQYDMLNEMKTDMIQGYYFGKPIDSEAFKRSIDM